MTETPRPPRDMQIIFKSVQNIASLHPGVLAYAGGHRVSWRPYTGWICSCPSSDPHCDHIAAVRRHIAPGLEVLTSRQQKAKDYRRAQVVAHQAEVAARREARELEND
jgi:hypothetical protein